jgi:hypothetical protein
MMLLLLSCIDKENTPATKQEDSQMESPSIEDSPVDSNDSAPGCSPSFEPLLPATPLRSIQLFPIANGYSAAVYSETAGAVISWYDHLYRAADPDSTSLDRLWDLYPGIRIDGTGQWLNAPPDSVSYHEGSSILKITQQSSSIQLTTLYLAPFSEGAERELVVLFSASNTDSSSHQIQWFSLENIHTGGEGNSGDELVFLEDGAVAEQGNGQTFYHTPLGNVIPTAAPSGFADNPYTRFLSGQNFAGTLQSGDDVAVGFQWEEQQLAPGESTWGGLVISLEQAPLWAQGLSPEQLLEQEEDGWRAWHAQESLPAQLTAEEAALYQQSTAFIRMAQVREEGSAYGQILASLPPGIWNITWPRDQSFAVRALETAGHREEADAATRFILNSDSGYYASYLGLSDYMVSVARYYGNGQEESDGAWCQDGRDAGPNIELDDWGLFLQQWAAGSKEQEADVQAGVVEPLLAMVQSNGLLSADSSIWERHWEECFPNGRKQFTWSTIQAIAGLNAAGFSAETFSLAAPVTMDGLCQALASSPEEICPYCGPWDASVVSAINWGVVAPDSELAIGTLAALERLRAPSGGYKRSDDGSGSSNPYPWYDDQEWIFIDLLLAEAMQKVGEAQGNPMLQENSRSLLDHVTAVGTVNAGILPELLSDGIYSSEDDADGFNLGQDGGQEAQGAWPMIGFGAGAYILALHELY